MMDFPYILINCPLCFIMVHIYGVFLSFGFFGRSPTYSNLEPIYVKALLVNIKILPFHWMSYLAYAYIFNVWRHPCHCLILATSKARVRYDMSNKQSLSLKNAYTLFFTIHLFKPSTVFGSVIFSTYKIYVVFGRCIFCFVTQEINTR